jgi:hypothetical protein
MSSSRPSLLIVDDDDDDWGAVSPLPTGSSTLSWVSSSTLIASSSTSGEFKPFAAVGALLSGGGGSRVSLGYRFKCCHLPRESRCKQQILR